MAKLGREAWLFTLIGAAGFGIDAGLLMLGHQLLGLGWPVARVISFSAAATVTWLLNRTLTFKDRSGTAKASEWRRYVAVNGVGAVLNLGIFLALIQYVPMFEDRALPALAVAACIALAFNFLGSRTVVFRHTMTTSTAPRHD